MNFVAEQLICTDQNKPLKLLHLRIWTGSLGWYRYFFPSQRLFPFLQGASLKSIATCSGLVLANRTGQIDTHTKLMLKYELNYIFWIYLYFGSKTAVIKTIHQLQFSLPFCAFLVSICLRWRHRLHPGHVFLQDSWQLRAKLSRDIVLQLLEMGESLTLGWDRPRTTGVIKSVFLFCVVFTASRKLILFFGAGASGQTAAREIRRFL